MGKLSSERPVRCAVCVDQMYYAGDARHEPEVEVRVQAEQKYTPSGINITMVKYVHLRCFNNFSIGKIVGNRPQSARDQRHVG